MSTPSSSRRLQNLAVIAIALGMVFLSTEIAHEQAIQAHLQAAVLSAE